jgi:hypothetical protein
MANSWAPAGAHVGQRAAGPGLVDPAAAGDQLLDHRGQRVPARARVEGARGEQDAAAVDQRDGLAERLEGGGGQRVLGRRVEGETGHALHLRRARWDGAGPRLRDG